MLTLQYQASPQGERYPEVPFELPSGVESLRVAYRVDPPTAVVDIGIFDPLEFRGYSGGARTHFTIESHDATPGYLPGPLPAGRWRVLLGLYQIPPEGARVTLKVDWGIASSGEALPRPVFIPPPDPRTGWLVGDLHCHTCHSDGRGTIRELMTVARSRGLQFLALTDHNTVSHHPPLLARDWGLIAIPGQEVTTFRGHFNVWGPVGWLDFRIRDEAQLRPVLEEAGRRGGLRSINHPKPTGCDWLFDHWRDVDAIEVWNGPWLDRNRYALERWHGLLCQGRRVTAVGGSDRHQPPLPDPDPPWLQVGSPATRVWVEEASAGGILSALKAGRCSVSQSPQGPFLSSWSEGREVTGRQVPVGAPLTVRVEGEGGARLRLITNKGKEIDTSDREVSLAFPKAAFVRAELYRAPAQDEAYATEVRRLSKRLPSGITAEEVLAHDRILALSNPVWVK